MVKIDTEGYELDVLKGMRGTFSREEKPLIMLENSGADALTSFLAPFGYKAYCFRREDCALAPFDYHHHETNLFFLPESRRAS